MSYLVLARKYRPQTFDEVLGQESVTRTLKNAIEQDRVAHAFLFSGPRGVGKTTMARVLAKALNCQSFDKPTITPCGTCGACVDIANSSAVDVLEIDGASNTGVDNIRELRETARYHPASHRYKIYIIDEVHMLSTAAFNALLKTLEEPPAHVKFIFATTEAHKVPATILSRCQRYDFRRVGMDELVRHLEDLCKREGITLPETSIRVIAREAEGSVRDSLSLLDQVTSFGADDLTEEEVLRALGVVDRATVSAICRAVLGRNPEATLEALTGAAEVGHDVKQLEKELLRWFHNLVIVKIAKDPSRILDLPDHEMEELKDLAKDNSLETLERLFDQLARLDEEIRRSGQPRALMEMTLVRMSLLPPLVPMAELLARLEQLESALRSGVTITSGPAGGGAANGPLFSGVPEQPGPGPAPSEAATCSDGEPAWEDFLSFVEKKDGKLFNFLSAGHFSGRTGREWRLSFPPESPMMERLKGNRNAGKIQEYMKDCFGDGHRLIFTEDGGLIKKTERKNAYEQENERRKEVMDDAVVHALLDKLGGDIEEINIK